MNELSGDSAYKQGEINRYVTDPRPDVPLGSVADLMYNGNEEDRKKRYLDYQTNPDAAGKSPMQAGALAAPLIVKTNVGLLAMIAN